MSHYQNIRRSLFGIIALGFFLSTFVSSAAIASASCAKEIAALVPQEDEVSILYVSTSEREVYQSIYDAAKAPKSEKDYFLAKSLKSPLITVKIRWDSDNGGGISLQILDAKTCKSEGSLRVSSW